eukprot:tig00000829_g4682.t2
MDPPTSDKPPDEKSPEEAWKEALEALRAASRADALPETTSFQAERLTALLSRNKRSFTNRLDPRDLLKFEHSLQLQPGVDKVNLPLYTHPRRMSPTAEEATRKEIEKLLRDDLIEPSQAGYGSPVVLAPKKDGTLRFCIDYRKLNLLTERDVFPLPRIDDQLERLRKARVFSTCDATSGFWQLPLSEESRKYTTFIVPWGMYQWKVTPFGITNGPSAFCRAISSIMGPLLSTCVVAYVDDLTIFSSTVDQHLIDLEAFFAAVERGNLKLKPSKCRFMVREIELLGHRVSGEGVRKDKKKMDMIAKWPEPSTPENLHSFVGLTGYYRRFVRNYARIAQPLYDVLKHRDKPREPGGAPQSFVTLWDDRCREAFRTLQTALIDDVALPFPHFNDAARPFIVTTDWSKQAMGAILHQADDAGNVRPLMFSSRTNGDSERNYGAVEGEAMTLLWALKQWTHYFECNQPFEIHTDHEPLLSLRNTSTSQPPNRYLAKVAMYLQGYNYIIKHCKGTTNGAADAMSRAPLNHPVYNGAADGSEDAPGAAPGARASRCRSLGTRTSPRMYFVQLPREDPAREMASVARTAIEAARVLRAEKERRRIRRVQQKEARTGRAPRELRNLDSALGPAWRSAAQGGRRDPQEAPAAPAPRRPQTALDRSFEIADRMISSGMYRTRSSQATSTAAPSAVDVDEWLARTFPDGPPGDKPATSAPTTAVAEDGGPPVPVEAPPATAAPPSELRAASPGVDEADPAPMAQPPGRRRRALQNLESDLGPAWQHPDNAAATSGRARYPRRAQHPPSSAETGLNALAEQAERVSEEAARRLADPAPLSGADQEHLADGPPHAPLQFNAAHPNLTPQVFRPDGRPRSKHYKRRQRRFLKKFLAGLKDFEGEPAMEEHRRLYNEAQLRRRQLRGWKSRQGRYSVAPPSIPDAAGEENANGVGDAAGDAGSSGASQRGGGQQREEPKSDNGGERSDDDETVERVPSGFVAPLQGPAGDRVRPLDVIVEGEVRDVWAEGHRRIVDPPPPDKLKRFMSDATAMVLEQHNDPWCKQVREFINNGVNTARCRDHRKLEIPEDQITCKWCLRAKEAYADMMDSYEIADGVVRRLPPLADMRSLVVVPETLREMILSAYHDDWAHRGADIVARRIFSRFWWDGMTSSVHRYVRSCPHCQRAKARRRPKVLCKIFEAYFPGDLHQADIMYLDLSVDGMVGAFVSVDAYSKYPDGKPIPDMKASTLRRCAEQALADHGVVQRYLIDNGSQLIQSEWYNFWKSKGTRIIRAAAFHQSTNGGAERLGQTFKRLVYGLCKAAGKSNRHWTEFVHQALLAMRTGIHAATGFPPAVLHFGRDLTLPGDLRFDPDERQRPTDPTLLNDRLAGLARAAESRAAAVAEHRKRYNKRLLRAHGGKPLRRSFRKGEKVLCWFEGLKRGIHNGWTGPFVVLRELSDGHLYAVKATTESERHRRTKELIVHIDLMIPYRDRPANVARKRRQGRPPRPEQPPAPPGAPPEVAPDA